MENFIFCAAVSKKTVSKDFEKDKRKTFISESPSSKVVDQLKRDSDACVSSEWKTFQIIFFTEHVRVTASLAFIYKFKKCLKLFK